MVSSSVVSSPSAYYVSTLRRQTIDIELPNFQLSGILRGHLFDYGSDQATRTTPRGPEVHQDWTRGLQYFLRKIPRSDCYRCCHTWSPPCLCGATRTTARLAPVVGRAGTRRPQPARNSARRSNQR